MRVLLGLTYFHPYVSGLTIYVERLASSLVSRGHTVTVLTSRHDPSLATEENLDGIRVVRVPVAARVSKGAIMPTLGAVAGRLMANHDIVSLHLPQFDAAGLTIRARLQRKPAILTYHCDLQLPPGLFNALVDEVVFGANYVAATLADRIVTNTEDYARHSRLLSRFMKKVEVIPPPVVMPSASAEEVAAFRQLHAPASHPIVGFAGRLATEKGVEHLVDAMPKLLGRFPDLQVLLTGPYRNVLGEEAYWRRLRPAVEKLDGHWKFLGTIASRDMPSFFGACDVLVVPSLNSTESFGMVQVEAMLCGTPVVASDLPGVREPIRMTGMGELVPPANPDALAEAVTRVLMGRDSYAQPRTKIQGQFAVERTLDAYESLFDQVVRKAAEEPLGGQRAV